MLGNPDIAESKTKDFNEQYPHFAVTQSDTVKLDDGLAGGEDGKGENSGDDLLAQLGIYRARMVRKDLWQPTVIDFERAWRGYKNENGLLDFQDLIDRALDLHYPPFQAQIGIFDEVQDFTPVQLKLIRRWAKYMEWILLAGDDDQCHPGSQLIETPNRGSVRIDELKPGLDLVIPWDRMGGDEIRRNGKEFKIAKRDYCGEILCFETSSGKKLEVTPNHKLFAKWRKDRQFIVYLQNKGDFWRVGTTRFNRSNGGKTGMFGLASRARVEGAERAWMLAAFDTEEESREYEDIVSVKYGITKMIFVPWQERTKASQEQFDKHHTNVSKFARWDECLFEHGLLRELPLWEKGSKRQKFGLNSLFVINAVNVNQDAMLLPTDAGNTKASWEEFRVSRKLIDEPVYSLSVQKYHNYSAGSIIVSNCLYGFTGATPDAFLNPPVTEDFKRVLRQSYRVPTKVLNLANRIVQKLSVREPKEYRPRDHEGKIFTSNATWKRPDNIIPVIKGYVNEGKRVMVLATCSYMLAPLIAQLRDKGIPFSNIYKANRGDWNPIRKRQTGNAGAYGRLCAYMVPQGAEFQGVRLWTPQQLESWTEPVKVDGNFQRGAKKTLKEMCQTKDLAPETVLGIMLQALTDEAFDSAVALDLEWFLSQITPAKQKSFDFPARVYKECGLDGPEMAKMVTIGTIHSVKGAESDVVVLFPDLSLRGAQHYATRQGEQFEQILRQFYVGVTRTRDILVLCQGITQGMAFRDYT